MPKLEGKKMFLFLAPKKAGVAKQSQQKRDRLAKEAEVKEQQQIQAQQDAQKRGLLGNAKGAEELLNKLGDK